MGGQEKSELRHWLGQHANIPTPCALDCLVSIHTSSMKPASPSLVILCWLSSVGYPLLVSLLSTEEEPVFVLLVSLNSSEYLYFIFILF